jgi:quinol monooxygenase YgiN
LAIERHEELKDMGILRSTIRMRIPLEKESEALEILCAVNEQVRFEQGCIASRLYRGVEDPPSIMLEQLWSSEEDALDHLRSDIYRKILLVVEMATEPPEVRFDLIAKTSGLETIERARCESRELRAGSIHYIK